MVRKIAVMAILASLAIAAPHSTPIERRTFPFPSFGGILGGESSQGVSESGSISGSAGFNVGVASGLEACIGGATAGSVDSGDKAALASWISGSGTAYFDFVTCSKIKSWCGASESFAVDGFTRGAIQTSLLAQPPVAKAGGAIELLNSVIEKGSEGGSCACSAISKGKQAELSGFLTTSGSSLETGVLGALHTSASGGFAESLSGGARGSLSAWLSIPECPLSDGLKGSIGEWISEGASGGVEKGFGEDVKGEFGDGSGGSAGGNVVIYGSAQSPLSSFAGGSAFGSLSWDMQGGLHACAAGDVSSSISNSVRGSLSGWLASPECPFDAVLRVACEAWLHGAVSPYTKTGTSADAYGYVAGGAKISGSFEASGALVSSAQGSFSAFI